ncbi:jg4934 [Pararge aegeria aegeria]|uniref:Jg4934 protein n=1 Tax=Pararge aegeria aegeria TaxID=348720 RepID=A0A8S4SJY3_9NEOP|nr:jg4934 [Pararge aegeria aegeria]
MSHLHGYHGQETILSPGASKDAVACTWFLTRVCIQQENCKKQQKSPTIRVIISITSNNGLLEGNNGKRNEDRYSAAVYDVVL